MIIGNTQDNECLKYISMRKQILLLMLVCITAVPAIAQQDEKNEMQLLQTEFNQYKHQITDEFNSNRDKLNKEFADYMKKEWEAFRSFQGIPVPKQPDPVTPPVKKRPDEKPDNHQIPQGNVVPLPELQTQPQPVAPIPVAPMPEKSQTLDFTFYGIPCSVSWNESLKYTLSSLKGEVLSDAWNQLSDKKYNAFLTDCIALRSRLSLCDWGYLELLQQITQSIFGSAKANESVLLQMYVLCQTGYKTRLAQSEETKLSLLICTNIDMYNRTYIDIEGAKYYVIGSDAKSFNVLTVGFPNEQSFSLQINGEQLATGTETAPKIFHSRAYPTESVSTGVNSRTINFYNSYPQCDWKIYAMTPLSSTIKKNVYPILEKAIRGKSEAEAANMLINFVQTAFEYKTDEEQFGYERTFFPDELFYYPYSDCEDRAVLYATLVRDLLHLNVVLLHYPNHLATAVHFNQDVTGNYLMVQGTKYLVCDPTYIGAPIGDVMPQFKNTQAEVIFL